MSSIINIISPNECPNHIVSIIRSSQYDNTRIELFFKRGYSATLFHRDELEIFYFSSEARKIIVREFIEV